MRTLRNTLALVTTLSLLATAATTVQAQKRPLQHEDYDRWLRITGQQISHDGRWVL